MDLVEGFPAVGELKVLVVDLKAKGVGFPVGGRLVQQEPVGPFLVASGNHLLPIDFEEIFSCSQAFDDHEVENNWVGDFAGKGTAPADIFRLRRQAGLQVWYEYMPVRAAMLPRNGIITDMYREARFGDLLSIDFLDTRSFRTDQPCGDGFKPYCPGIDDSKAQVISPEEESWLTRNLTRRQAPHKKAGAGPRHASTKKRGGELMELVNHTVINLIIFVLAIYVGYHVVWTVTPALHTPLMAVTNAISAIIIIGAMLAAGLTQTGLGRTMGVVAVALAAVNVFGGFLVTQRMLEMFKKKEPKAKADQSEGAKQ